MTAERTHVGASGIVSDYFHRQKFVFPMQPLIHKSVPPTTLHQKQASNGGLAKDNHCKEGQSTAKERTWNFTAPASKRCNSAIIDTTEVVVGCIGKAVKLNVLTDASRQPVCLGHVREHRWHANNPATAAAMTWTG